METSGYVTLTRQSGLMREMEIIAHNMANVATTGFRQQGIVFSEYIEAVGQGDSLSMAAARVKSTSMSQGILTQTGNPLDLAIEGNGFFQLETQNGIRLTRAGAFNVNSVGDIVTAEGHRVLDIGGAPINVPPGEADVTVAADGTVSLGEQLLGQLGVVEPEAGADLKREAGVLFQTDAALIPAANGLVLQGHLEGSNVDAISQLTRLIEVQRAYEMGQKLLDMGDERSKSALQTLIK
ncbi:MULTISPECIES: flagellar hook-basal body complex protein [Marivita]|uniref:Flagellar basal-body rod protein FlgF n=1 Tax=Marivita cryptomonadis TaxID=505252 RepID=A0A9Q2S1W3_9RHOB|nr:MULTISPECIES: flagellar hook-basal body complex protein [Marivita]MCR9167630.1 flagellar hook-basal body complex protein [Paracoccaceae bacterium]MBM2322012.1 flagellar hook-basal body complex protein [Marivita cryptomonadis]MBM2331361.1 flagellar hook-basal body complex protein [Marivita cryptomonadis]MBM2340947.1 flagellar hook-basal body complex protein [Marivita cryptomonadis]MBM2345609.1 flagellar hook-basal body complex protein [Marivita cryptomonadis]